LLDVSLLFINFIYLYVRHSSLAIYEAQSLTSVLCAACHPQQDESNPSSSILGGQDCVPHSLRPSDRFFSKKKHNFQNVRAWLEVTQFGPLIVGLSRGTILRRVFILPSDGRGVRRAEFRYTTFKAFRSCRRKLCLAGQPYWFCGCNVHFLAVIV